MKVFVLVAVLAFGCKKTEPPLLRLDAQLTAQVALKVAAAGDTPASSAAVDEMFAAIGKEPELVVTATVLFGALSADDRIVEPLGALMDQLGDHPVMMTAVEELMREHPDASADQIGEMVGQRFEGLLDTPAVDTAVAAAGNDFVRVLKTRVKLKKLEAALTTRANALEGDRKRTAKWNARLVELNDGKKPDPARAAELYVQHAWSTQRIEKYLRQLTTKEVIRKETAKLFIALLQLPGMGAELKEAVARIVADRALMQKLLDTFVALYSAEPDTEKLRSNLSEILMTPVVIDTVSALLQKLVDDPKAAEAADRWFEAIRTDAGVRRDFFAFLDGW